MFLFWSCRGSQSGSFGTGPGKADLHLMRGLEFIPLSPAGMPWHWGRRHSLRHADISQWTDQEIKRQVQMVLIMTMQTTHMTGKGSKDNWLVALKNTDTKKTYGSIKKYHQSCLRRSMCCMLVCCLIRAHMLWVWQNRILLYLYLLIFLYIYTYNYQQ